jgi:putative ABC transport system permease protein
MIDVMTFFIKLMLVAIVLISILNVMIMAVYERVREIGTIAAIGTQPRKILSLFLVEGFCQGLAGTVVGVALGWGIVWILSVAKISFVLAPSLDPGFHRRCPE